MSGSDSKRDRNILFITILLVGVMIAALIYDYGPNLLKRTTPELIHDNKNLELVEIDKVGFMFYRKAYSAKLLVKDGYWEGVYNDLCVGYDMEGMFLKPNEYPAYEAEALQSVSLKPKPSKDAVIWIAGVGDEKEDIGSMFLIDQEDDGKAYVYIYFSR